jgi:hypothetical protein
LAQFVPSIPGVILTRVKFLYFQVSKEDYKTALTMLGKDVKIAYHTFFYNKWLQIGLFSCVFITLWMMGFLLWHTGGLPDRIGIGLFFILANQIYLVL